MNYHHGGEIYGKDIRLDFSVSLNPLGCPESVKRAINGGCDGLGVYPDITYKKLRKAITSYENARYHNGSFFIRDDQIVPGNGASELIMAMAYMFSGRSVLIKLPVFAGYERAFDRPDCKVIYSGPGKDTSIVEKIRSEKPFLVVIGSPINPTGEVVSPDELRSIASACNESGSFLLCDEAFMGFVPKRNEYSLASLFYDYSHLIVIRSFTKLYSCPGLRIGYAVCSEAEVADELRSFLPEWNVSLPAENAMVALCGEGEFADRSVSYVASERERMTSLMSEMGLEVYPSEANYLFFRSRPGLYGSLLEKGLLIRDCSDYKGFDDGTYYRIGIRTQAENDELLSAIRELI